MSKSRVGASSWYEWLYPVSAACRSAGSTHPYTADCYARAASANRHSGDGRLQDYQGADRVQHLQRQVGKLLVAVVYTR